jgi:hypothetical protein
MSRSLRHRCVATALGGAAVGFGIASALSGSPSTGASRQLHAPTARTAAVSGPVPVPFLHVVKGRPFATPPTTAQCEAEFGVACYDPA